VGGRIISATQAKDPGMLEIKCNVFVDSIRRMGESVFAATCRWEPDSAKRTSLSRKLGLDSTETISLVRRATIAFERIRGYARPRAESKDFIMKVADEK
jgi:hypothetical protein